MTGAAPRTTLPERLIAVLPVLAALNVHAIAHHRLLIALPLELLLGVVALADVKLRHSSRSLIASGVALALVAFGLQLAGAFPDLPPRPFPPIVLGPLTAFVAGLAVHCAVTRNSIYAWTYAWLLAILCCANSGGAPLYVSLGVLCLTMLAAAFARGRIGRHGWLGAGSFVGFALLVAGATEGLSVATRASEGLLMEALGRYLREAFHGGVGMESSIWLRARSSVELSQRPLFEIAGAIPERLRTTMLDRFDGGRWSEWATDPRRSTFGAAAAVASARTELFFLDELAPYLPVPAGTIAIAGVDAEQISRGLWRAPRLRGLTAVLGRQLPERLPLENPPGTWSTSLPPALQEPLRAHARRIGGAGSPREKANRTAAHFRDKHLYSLTTDLLVKGRHPLLVLIEEARPAYCTYFASAMAALLRSEGIPARLAAGFVPGELNPLTGRAVVRERDAHAWVEVFLEDGAGDGRWEAFDPTPWSSRDEQLGIDRQTSRVGQAFGAVAGLFRRAVAAPAQFFSALATPWLLVPIAAIVAFRIFRRRGAPSRVRRPAALTSADANLRALHASWLRALRDRAGLSAAPADTDADLVERLRSARGEAAARAAGRFVEGYQRARFQGSAPPANELQAALVALEAALLDAPRA